MYNKYNQKINMKSLPRCEQPYEKCEQQGAQVLTDAELLSVMIRTGTREETSVELARRILSVLPGQSIGGLFGTSIEELQELKGIGRVKSIQLVCMVELARRMIVSGLEEPDLICDQPETVAAYYMNTMRFLETEQVRMLVLDGKNRLLRDKVISTGTFNASMAAPREIFYYALKHKAVRILLLHNHPSGDPTPSREDLSLTSRIVQTGSMIGIPLIDHIIIGDNRYISLKQSGYISEE